MSKIFDNYVSEERKNYPKVPMKTMKDVENELGVLIGYLHSMIYDNCESDKRADEVSQEIMTDIFVPAIKIAYQDAIDYLLWGRLPYRQRGRSNRVISRYDRDYQYTDEECEENTKDED